MTKNNNRNNRNDRRNCGYNRLSNKNRKQGQNNGASFELSGLIKELDAIQTRRDYPIFCPVPRQTSSKSAWIYLSNVLTVQYNREVHFYDPYNMPAGDYINISDCDCSTEDMNENNDNPDNNSVNNNVKQTNTNSGIGKKRKRREVKVEIKDIKTLQDLIDLIDTYPEDPTVKYDIDLRKLYNISKPLRELNSMIGLDKLKESVVDQILYFAQNLHKSPGGNETMDYMHTVLYGPPGTGKTEVAMMMGKIYCGLGILKKGHFTKVTRSDLVAGYLGQTAIKTKKAITNALDGVLFIDEAYSLGHPDKRDSFAQECIDTLCESASALKDRLVIIIAGYEKELNERFFAWNTGLNSRFPWRHETTEYNPKELSQIFRKKIHDARWACSIKPDMLSEWFDNKKEHFTYFGRDMELLFSKIKICHAHRVFGKKSAARRWVTDADLEMGLTSFIANRQTEKKKDDMSAELRATLYT